MKMKIFNVSMFLLLFTGAFVSVACSVSSYLNNSWGWFNHMVTCWHS